MTENRGDISKDISDQEHQELCLLYENAANNLDLIKKSQWQVYVFYSAVAAVLISQKQEIINHPPIALLISFLLFAGVIIIEFYTAYFRFDMLKYRGILTDLYNKRFGNPFREIRIANKGEKKPELNCFEKVFRHVGCAYVFVVFYLAINTLWPNEYRLTYISMLCQSLILLSVIVIPAIILPFVMDKCVNYIDRKTKKNIPASSVK